MAPSLLARLGRSADQLAALADGTRLGVLHFLLNWEAVPDALAILSRMEVEASDESHLLAAIALRRAGRIAEAFEVLNGLRARVSTGAAQVEFVRTLIAARDLQQAEAEAERLAQTASGVFDSWLLQGDLHLAAHDPLSADTAFHMAQRQNGAEPAPLVGRLRAALALNDHVAVTARLAEVANLPGGMEALRNDEVQVVRTALDFAAAPPGMDAVAINQMLMRRFDRDLARVLESLARGSQAPVHSPNPPAIHRNTPKRPHQPIPQPLPQPLPANLPRVSRRELAEITNGARTLFGHTTLLALQAEVIASTRRGEDVLAVLPTGGGKSLCYQLPAWLDQGTTLVISPLLALMKDQVDNLPARLRSQAVAITSDLWGDELKRTLAEVGEGRYRLVFTAPERLRQRSFVTMLRGLGIARLVVDEAHCVSIWGHDFRPDYLHLAQVHADLGSPPLLALTATAPPNVRADILRLLFSGTGRTVQQVVGNPGRPNLWLGAMQVRDEQQREERIASLCHTIPGSGVVYVRSRARADSLAALLRERGIESAPYHAGVTNRTGVQERFASGALRIVVATVAFGMGVDKRDIRFVIHAGLPDSVDSYLQETGRAGRDGNSAICMLYYTDRDLDAQSHFAQRETLDTTMLLDLYDAIVRGAGNGKVVTLRLDQVAQAMRSEETALRVALSTLEEVGLITRDYDVPRSVSIYLRKPGKGSALQRFLQAARVQPGAPAQWDWHELAIAAEIAPDKLEPKLIEWQGLGYLNYYGSGREMLLHLRALRIDPNARIEALLTRRSKARQERSAQVVRFVQSGRCRHALLAEYSGATSAERCEWCDNCGVPLSRLLAR